MTADLPYVLPILVLVAERSLASGDRGQQTVAAQNEGGSLQSPQYCGQIPCWDGERAGWIEPPRLLQETNNQVVPAH